MHVLPDANGLPLLVGLSAANTHDSLALKPMVLGHQRDTTPTAVATSTPTPARGQGLRRSPPAKMASRETRVRIARKGVESSERLGRRRWVIERIMSWLTGYRRLKPPLRTPPRQLPALPRPRRHPLLLQMPRPPHHTRHGLMCVRGEPKGRLILMVSSCCSLRRWRPPWRARGSP
ncbi:transposase [Streptomyces virginiae]|uniref:transposase n=1 Tax=Streptomyces virginiae TaxID=1961 RepID=UPI003D80A264